MIARRIDGRVVKFEGNPGTRRTHGTWGRSVRRVRARSRPCTTPTGSSGRSSARTGRV
jgi:hypothetical protein